MSNSLRFISLLLGIALGLASCNENKPQQQNISTKEAPKTENINPQSLYMAKCVACHGSDGKLGAAGAKNLADTKLTVDEVKKQITNGKGAMPPFSNQLNEAEIQAIAEYVLTELKEIKR
jgi:mono/diheme cytochrome c family protein